MNKIARRDGIRRKIASGEVSIGGWMQIPSSEVAEIYGAAGYDWVAIDMEHGSIDVSQLPNLFRALELGDTLPLVRLRHRMLCDVRRVFEAGAAGVIVPNVESDDELKLIIQNASWPPDGGRGVGYSRSNLYGKNFEKYKIESNKPLIVAMIESKKGVDNLDLILDCEGLDAIFIGPYDLSASLGVLGQFDSTPFIDCIEKIKKSASKKSVAVGMHVIEARVEKLKEKIREGYTFIAYSLDSVILNTYAHNPYEE